MPRKKSASRASLSGAVKALGNGLKTFALHSLDEADQPTIMTLRAERAGAPPLVAALGAAATDPETIATRYLRHVLASPAVPGLAAASGAGVEEEFKSLGTETIPLTDTKTVKFRQTFHKIPVYGSLVTVELDENNEPLSVRSSLADPNNVSPVAKISPADAVAKVGAIVGQKALAAITPRLNYYHDGSADKWRLVYILEDVPIVTKKGKAKKTPGPMYMDFVVDAHTGTVVARLPRTPSMASVVISAVDGLGKAREIRIEQNGSVSVLHDTALNVQTFDFAFGDPLRQKKSLPGGDVRLPPSPWPPGAVSAHANAAAVAKFLREVLQRANLDNQGGPMISSVNCVVPGDREDPHQWVNAFWNRTQMVYGQRREGNGFLSLAVNLDVVAHEMFHGVTDFTARLEYLNQSGALNESYSDIFGTIVSNFDKPDVDDWNWEIGEGLRPTGEPFRDMKNPARFGQPAHMRDYQQLSESDDEGGVHTNSGIHNHAAYLMLTAKDSSGAKVLPPQEVAAAFYIALTQYLSRTSGFSDSREGVLFAAQTLFRKRPRAEKNAKLAAIKKSFSAVGIEDPPR